MTERSGLEKLIDSEKALEHVAAHGWSRPKGEKLFSAKVKQDSSKTTHDPEAVVRLGTFSVEVLTLAIQYGKGIPGVRRSTYVEPLKKVYEHLEENGKQRKLNKLDKKLSRLADEVNGWLVDRQVKVLGCNPPDDCHTVDRVCGHAGINGCTLKRK